MGFSTELQPAEVQMGFSSELRKARGKPGAARSEDTRGGDASPGNRNSVQNLRVVSVQNLREVSLNLFDGVIQIF